MTNSQITEKFLAAIDSKTKTEILSSIAAHYGISAYDAYVEVIDEDAEHLLDYLIGNIRTATSVLMKRHGF